MSCSRRALARIALPAAAASLAAGAVSASAAVWSPVGTGMNGAVQSIATDAAGNVYAGGQFTTAGGAAVSNIAEWTGAAWSGMGLTTGMNGPVYSVLVAPDGRRFVGGAFSTGGVTAVSNIAQWNGLSFEPLTQGTNNAVWSMAASQTAFYVGGDFTVASGTATNNIGRWQGTFWSFLGANAALDGRVMAMAFAPNGDLYVGGQFSSANGVAGTARIARWDGTRWSALSAGIAPTIGRTNQNSWVEDLAFDAAGNLYVAGYFTAAQQGIASVPAQSVAKWDGTRWTAVGTTQGANNAIVRALGFDAAGTLYAGGDFDQLGATNAANIAKWTGSVWAPVGSGMNGTVYDLHTDSRGNLYAGGTFTAADGVTTNRIAMLPAPGVTPATPATPAPCASTFYQQAARTWKNAKAPNGRSAVKVTSRIRIFQDVNASCRKNLTFIFRDARTKKRLDQLPGSTLGYRKLQGQDFSAPVISWPTTREMRFTTGDTTGQNRRNARLVLVSYLRKTRATPAQRYVELAIVRQVPRDAAQGVSATNPLFAQLNAFGAAKGWAQTS